MPCYSYGQKLSKLAILRIACNYILSLARLADLDYSADHSNLSFAECVQRCTRTLQAEGRAKKRKVRGRAETRDAPHPEALGPPGGVFTVLRDRAGWCPGKLYAVPGSHARAVCRRVPQSGLSGPGLAGRCGSHPVLAFLVALGAWPDSAPGSVGSVDSPAELLGWALHLWTC